MAQLEFKGEKLLNKENIEQTMRQFGLHYEHWGVRSTGENDDVLAAYGDEIQRLKSERGYVTADLVALDSQTPNLDAICKKFDQEHHHTEDEVRFVVEGEGVFELAANESSANDWLKFTSEPGDLIVIPANRRHKFYLTQKRNIRCIRLFKTQEGWEAIYKKS